MMISFPLFAFLAGVVHRVIPVAVIAVPVILGVSTLATVVLGSIPITVGTPPVVL
jgi:hypothetical protein